MSHAAGRKHRKGSLELIEEATHLLRLGGAATLLCYYVGSLPFVLGLLYFWADMSQSAFAPDRLAGAAFGLALLFLWMKTWQALFLGNLMAQLCGEPIPQMRARRWLRTAAVQTILQPSGLFLVPGSFLLLLPFAWVYAFYQNVTALGGGADPQLLNTFRQARQQAQLWPRQNHAALLAWGGFALFVFVNVMMAIFAIPTLLKTLVGIETVLSRFMQNPLTLLTILLSGTILGAALGLTYLAVDPFLKTYYLLRCFYGMSLTTGADLTAELRRSLPGASLGGLLLVLWLCLPGPASAAQPRSAPPPPSTQTVDAQELDRSIGDVLGRREYAWRLPRPEKEETEKGLVTRFLDWVKSWLESGLKTLGRWIQKAISWLEKWLNPPSPRASSGSFGWRSLLHGLIFVLAVVLAVLLALLCFRIWQRQRRARTEERPAHALASLPDLADDQVDPSQLPEESWLQWARELLGQGDLRMALRAFYLASLAHLAGRSLIAIARFKSNHDYERELQRRSHSLPELFSLFRQNVSVFDRVWYGRHPVTPPMLNEFAGNVERIRSA